MFFKRSLEDRVVKAKKNKEELNKLIEEYKPFIASTVQKKVGKFVKYGSDDELSIGMMAFKEAVDCYDKNKGKFLSFARQVINLRIIDYYRKQERTKNEVYLQGINDEEDESTYDKSSSKAIAQFKDKEINEMRRLEIIEYKKELQKWGIDFSQLVKASPKQEKTRNLYKKIAQLITQNEDILHNLVTTKKLPIKELQKIYPVHRKKLERGRIYIIALVIVLTGQFEYIKEYVEWRWEYEGDSNGKVCR